MFIMTSHRVADRHRIKFSKACRCKWGVSYWPEKQEILSSQVNFLHRCLLCSTLVLNMPTPQWLCCRVYYSLEWLNFVFVWFTDLLGLLSVLVVWCLVRCLWLKTENSLNFVRNTYQKALVFNILPRLLPTFNTLLCQVNPPTVYHYPTSLLANFTSNAWNAPPFLSKRVADFCSSKIQFKSWLSKNFVDIA